MTKKTKKKHRPNTETKDNKNKKGKQVKKNGKNEEDKRNRAVLKEEKTRERRGNKKERKSEERKKPLSCAMCQHARPVHERCFACKERHVFHLALPKWGVSTFLHDVGPTNLLK